MYRVQGEVQTEPKGGVQENFQPPRQNVVQPEYQPARKGFKNYGRGYGRGGGRGLMCYNCGEQGHIQIFCTKPFTICGYCRSMEHDTEECTELLAKSEAKRGNIHMVVAEPRDLKDQHMNVCIMT